MYANEALLTLLKTIGSPLVQKNSTSGYYTAELYSIAKANKIPLTYLNTISVEERQKLPEYKYHHTRLRRLMEIMAEISELFDEEGVEYVIFKTLRPYLEDVADIDILNMGSCKDYRRIVETLRQSNYLLMEKGTYCITFQDYKTYFKTEIMIDVYDEISVGHLIYLDKRNLNSCVVRKKSLNGAEVKVFAPEAELLTTVAHSAIKENTYILSEYYATLHYLALMDQSSIERLVNLVRENKLVSPFRWHLTITATLHTLAYGFVPEKLSNMLDELSGPWERAYRKVFKLEYPPYKCDLANLVSIFKEKLYDTTFRRSLCAQLLHPPTRMFTARLLVRLKEVLR